jgi:hypothetical protein
MIIAWHSILLEVAGVSRLICCQLKRLAQIKKNHEVSEILVVVRGEPESPRLPENAIRDS